MIDILKNLFPRFLKRYYHEMRFFLSSLRYGFPQNKLKLIGVTGSSGKSTTCSMIYHILKSNGEKVGLISTVGAYIDDSTVDIGLHVTTPDAHDIVKLLKTMLEKDIEYVILEASSHALAQGRLGNLSFLCSAYTNITSDHIDWHKSWDNYADSKAKLIKMTSRKGLVVLNKDDEKGYNYLRKSLERRKIKSINYSSEYLQKIKSGLKQEFIFEGITFHLDLIGSYNISNALAAIEVVKFLRMDLTKISKSLLSFKTLEGRMEIIKEKPFTIILDFAHNTDSLSKSLLEIRALLFEGKLISLFGSAGLRDKNKRYDMGKVAGEICDIVIVVPEDPRTEDLVDINNKILKGAEDSGLKLIKRFSSHEEYQMNYSTYLNSEKGVFVFDYTQVQARVDGIELGLRLLKENDILVTQGKGHERSLSFGTKEYDYNEKLTINNLLKDLKL